MLGPPRRREDRRWRLWLGSVGLALILAGYATLMIDPEAVTAEATRRAFAGMGLVIAGAALALFSRWL